FNHMRSGRPGPTAINLPMDVQAASADVELAVPDQHLPGGVPQGDPAQIEQAVELFAEAKRPVILVGGGVITANASQALRKVAEASGGAVVNTMMGIGAFPADHPLYAWATGSKGTSCGLQLTQQADVLLAVGCRFADETASSYRPGVSFSIPPTKLIHVDLDESEIGKNYPVTVGIIGDANAVLGQMAEALRERGLSDYAASEYVAQIQQLKQEWTETLEAHRDDSKVPVMISTVLQRLRPLLDRDAIVVTSSGNVQAQIIQEFEFYQPRTCVTAGGFSTMGFTLPAALGARLAAPDRQVVGLIGDGDFMMHMQELSTAVRYNLPVVIIILNNSGWISIRDLQMAAYGEETAFATDFMKSDAEYSPPLAEIARSFGCHGQCISRADEIEPAVRAALRAEGPAVIEILVNRQFPYTGTPAVGWWDVPVPGYLTERRAQYDSERGEENLR
ncbi:MAG: thiamine pyrophosphate-binding protein, partial [Armatimonadetes bacterium]|nr:thiamine pyrophosphate-binding protein [Armatimonadota bacterium]